MVFEYHICGISYCFINYNPFPMLCQYVSLYKNTSIAITNEFKTSHSLINFLNIFIYYIPIQTKHFLSLHLIKKMPYGIYFMLIFITLFTLIDINH